MPYTEGTVLGLVKSRLNRMQSDTRLDEYLKARIKAADGELARTGIRLLEDSPDDAMFLCDIVAW